MAGRGSRQRGVESRWVLAQDKNPPLSFTSRYTLQGCGMWGRRVLPCSPWSVFLRFLGNQQPACIRHLHPYFGPGCSICKALRSFFELRRNVIMGPAWICPCSFSKYTPSIYNTMWQQGARFLKVTSVHMHANESPLSPSPRGCSRTLQGHLCPSSGPPSPLKEIPPS